MILQKETMKEKLICKEIYVTKVQTIFRNKKTHLPQRDVYMGVPITYSNWFYFRGSITNSYTPPTAQNLTCFIFRLWFSCRTRVSNPQPMDCLWPRITTNGGQHKIMNLLKTLYDVFWLCVTMYLSVAQDNSSSSSVAQRHEKFGPPVEYFILFPEYLVAILIKKERERLMPPSHW